MICNVFDQILRFTYITYTWIVHRFSMITECVLRENTVFLRIRAKYRHDQKCWGKNVF